MSKIKDELRNLVEGLEQDRDELKMKLHLASLETREDWDLLEAKLEQLKAKAKANPAAQAASETAENVLAGLKLTAGELKDGFNRIRKQL